MQLQSRDGNNQFFINQTTCQLQFLKYKVVVQLWIHAADFLKYIRTSHTFIGFVSECRAGRSSVHQRAVALMDLTGPFLSKASAHLISSPSPGLAVLIIQSDCEECAVLNAPLIYCVTRGIVQPRVYMQCSSLYPFLPDLNGIFTNIARMMRFD